MEENTSKQSEEMNKSSGIIVNNDIEKIKSNMTFKIGNDVKELFDNSTLKLKKDEKERLVSVLSHHFSNLIKIYNTNNSSLLQINLSNSTLKSFNSEILVNFLESVGFKKKSNSNNILVIDIEKLKNLEEFDKISIE